MVLKLKYRPNRLECVRRRAHEAGKEAAPVVVVVANKCRRKNLTASVIVMWIMHNLIKTILLRIKHRNDRKLTMVQWRDILRNGPVL